MRASWNTDTSVNAAQQYSYAQMDALSSLQQEVR
ncbi:Hypothetical protein Deide_14190 [Deinococcus deserti VCD115]|uniref:Uncharacterized protein n=1 Tax=Deinococcus deserti (strain DSM 17065 / CIP 109153 / LMG 22923 / VCD115) TaxID=546414 RepID=C1CVZ9_DEIDV|nr:Hypothetical protein Deide_14190 [Deinococcus deserti VCD115]